MLPTAENSTGPPQPTIQKPLLILLAAWMLMATALGCIPPETGSNGKPRPILLRDRNRDTFDITHAVMHYKMNRHLFEHGIGKTAFPLLQNPPMATPGQRGYPSDHAREKVIGTQINGDTRSYSINAVVRHEIVNDTIGGTQAAVAY